MIKTIAALLQLGVLFSAELLLAQGSLSPTGAPTPIMKRLDAIDPGQPLNPASFGTTGIIIDKPGTYYLTGNVTTVPATEPAIVVLAQPVTIDLRGFALIAAGGTAGGSSDSAVFVGTGHNNITVRNGSIRGAWWAGVFSQTRQCAVEDVRVAGTIAYGIRLDDHSQVSRCRVDGLSVAGFISTAGIFVEDDSLVQECTVTACDGLGIQAATGASVSDCVANGNTLDGFSVGDGSVVARCSAGDNAGKGIELAAGGTVSDCTAYDNDLSGVTGTTAGNVANTSAYSSGDRGFSFVSATFVNSVAVRSTNAGFAITRASSLSQCVAGVNSGDGFFADSVGSTDDAVVFEGCVADANGTLTTNANADGFEADAMFKMVRCLAVSNVGWGLRVAGNVSDAGTVDGNLLIANDAGGIVFPSSFGSPVIVRNGVGPGNISPPPSSMFYDLLAPFGTAQSDQPFVNF